MLRGSAYTGFGFGGRGARPAIVDITKGDDAGTNATSHVVALPSSITSGQLLIVLFGQREDADATFPAGWTEFFDAGTAGQAGIAGAYRVADGAEGASITVTTTANRPDAWAVIRIAAGTFKSGTAPEAGTVATGSSTTPNPPSLTPSWSQGETLWIAACALKDAATARTVSSWPTGYADNQTSQSSNNTHELFFATKFAEAASDDPGTFTVSATGQWAAQTIAIRPNV